MKKLNAAQRRYQRRYLAAFAIYAIVLLGTNRAFDSLRPHGGVDIALAILPALPLLAAIWVIGIYLGEERDEYLRAQMVRSMVAGTGLMLATCTVWGFLEIRQLAGHVPAWSAFPLWAVCFAIANGAFRLADRSEGRP